MALWAEKRERERGGDGSKMDALTRVSSEADAERGNPLMGIEPQDGVHQL